MNILRKDGTTVQLFGKTYYEMRAEAFEKILKLYVFDDPTPGRGLNFEKLDEYLNGNRNIKQAIDAINICYKMGKNDEYEMYPIAPDFVFFIFNICANESIGVKRKNISDFIKYMEFAKNEANVFVFERFLNGIFKDFDTSLLEPYIDDESVEFIYFQNNPENSFWVEDGEHITLKRAKEKMKIGLCDVMEFTFGKSYKLVEDKSTGEIKVI